MNIPNLCDCKRYKENGFPLPFFLIKIFFVVFLRRDTCNFLYFFSSSHHSRQYLMIGLFFSSIGDILLNHELFPHGMGVFGIAQAFYIASFGFKPCKPMIGIVLYCIGVAGKNLFQLFICKYKRNCLFLLGVSLFYTNLPSILQIGLPIYGILLLTMCWRAIARFTDHPCDMKNFPKLACAIGAVLFVISDSLIAFDKFYIPLSFAPVRS